MWALERIPRLERNVGYTPSDPTPPALDDREYRNAPSSFPQPAVPRPSHQGTLAASAYPIEILAAEKVVNDVVGPQEVVIVTDPKSKAARAYDAQGRTFAPGAVSTEVIDESGAVWRLTEDALVRADDASQSLPRLAGNDVFWFGWYAFHPQTKLYTGAK